MSRLFYVPKEEFDRILSLNAPDAVRLQLFADACRLNVLYMISRAGSGHIGTSFSAMDIMVTLQLRVLRGLGPSLTRTEDVFFSSKGHDVPARYAVLLACGLLDFSLIHRLRLLGGLPGHPDVGTPYCYTNTGSLGMGISKARGVALARRQLGQRGDIFVLTGDGELQEGQFWESLQPTANGKLDEITVIVDHNKIQSDTWVSRVSDLGDLVQKTSSFGWDVSRLDGHNFDELISHLPRPQSGTGRPRLLVADTVKGKGVSFMEPTSLQPPDDRLYPFHSGAPSPQQYADAVQELCQKANQTLADLDKDPLHLATVATEAAGPMKKAERLVPVYGEALVEAARNNSKLVALDADLAKDTGLIGFEQCFPDRFYECGIAEQDMVSQAGGMALAGLLPVVHSFACFLSDRPNEQIYNNATEGTKILYVGSLAGLVPSGPGHSHQCVRDIAALAGVPSLIAVEPCCERETRLLVGFATDQTKDSVYLRLVSIPCELPYELPAAYRPVLGEGVILREGQDVVVIGYGPVMLAEAYHAAALLQRDGIGVRIVNFPWLNRADRSWLKDCVARFSVVVTLDNHYVEGGQGQFLLAELAKCPELDGQYRASIGVDRIPECGRNEEVLRAHRLDAQSLAIQIQAAVEAAATRHVDQTSPARKAG